MRTGARTRSKLDDLMVKNCALTAKNCAYEFTARLVTAIEKD